MPVSCDTAVNIQPSNLYEFHINLIGDQLKISEFKQVTALWHQNQTDTPMHEFSAFSDAKFVPNCCLQKAHGNHNSMVLHDENNPSLQRIYSVSEDKELY